MAPEFFLTTAVNGALKLLPPNMNTLQAKAMIVAICLQESRLQFRRQVGGPARGYAQFESGGGVTGVLNHATSSNHARSVCASLDVNPTVTAVYTALEQNDILAAAFARLLLWTLPNPLPEKTDVEGGWQQYMAAWRPGKPHRETWDANWNLAWGTVEEAAKIEELTAKVLEIKDAAVSFIADLELLQASVRSVNA